MTNQAAQPKIQIRNAYSEKEPHPKLIRMSAPAAVFDDDADYANSANCKDFASSLNASEALFDGLSAEQF